MFLFRISRSNKGSKKGEELKFLIWLIIEMQKKIKYRENYLETSSPHPEQLVHLIRNYLPP